ncbi:isoprenoid synthase domain-containing protein [Mycena sp. CBHHK59/15]|nr:isoprenoid synthase domain-containing protein [Mycena sp. CBHHK59/15]
MNKFSIRTTALTVGLISVLAYFIRCHHLPPILCRVYQGQDVRPPTYSEFLPPFISGAFCASRPAYLSTGDKRERFENAFVTVRLELLDYFVAQGVPDDAREWYARNIDYNVLGGKLNRGMSVVDSLEIMKGCPLSEDKYLQAAVLGWAVEFLQAYFLVLDDLMDKSITRRGQLCYYRVPGVGNISVNDAGMLESAIYQLLKMHFRNETYYVDLLELFHETTFQTSTGQLLDLITAPEDSVDLSKISIEKFRLIALYKTAHYSFYLPVALAMLMCNTPTEYRSAFTTQTIRPYSLARAILLPIGEYFQVQDDFLDFAGTPQQIGKIGTDIIDNKCSWCINTALSVASPKQRAILDANYGRREAGTEEKVKAVFEDVELRERYQAYEEKTYADIIAMIEAIPEEEGFPLRRQVFTNFLHKIYKRQK